MIAFLLTIYSAIVIALFKLKVIKPRPYPIAMIIVAGVLLIGGVVVAWSLCAPVSPRVVTAQYVVQLVPYVKGQVIKVHAAANQPVKRGDLLLEINPAPYQYALDQVQAQLYSAQEAVKQAEAGLGAAKANVLKAEAGVRQAQAAINQAQAAVANAQAGVAKAKAADDLAKTEEEIALNLQKIDTGAISELCVTQAKQNRSAAAANLQQAEAGVVQAQAGEQQSEAALVAAQSSQNQAEAAAGESEFAVKVAESNVTAIEAQLEDARFNLEQCKMYAPADGYVVNWQVQEGTMLVPMPLAAAGTFVNNSATAIVASFPQNYLANVRAGNPVELVLDPYPGRLFKGEVETVITATGEGQFAPDGTIPQAAKVGSQGLLAVKIRLTGDNQPRDLPLGAGGMVAIYTDHGKSVHIISKVTMRMKKWLLYVIPA